MTDDDTRFDGLETFAEESDPKARRLRALAGPGRAYIFLSWGTDDEETHIDFSGLYPEDVATALRQIAEMI